MELNMSVIISIASAFVALCSFGFTLFVYFRTDRKIKNQQIQINDLDLNKKKEDSENKRKAKIRARMIKEKWVSEDGRVGYERYLVIENKGKSQARNVNIESDMFQEGSGVIALIEDGLLPYPILGEDGDSLKINIEVFTSSKPTYSIMITWDDDFGENNKYTQVVSRQWL